LWEQKRGAAKKAVTEMLRAGITLDQISQEGIDLDLLYQLFPELGLGASAGKISGREAQLSLNKSHVTRSDRSLESGEVSEGDGRLEILQSDGTVNAAKQQAPSSANAASDGTAQSTQQPLSSKPVEERKDYIARLLAAKQSMAKDSIKSAVPALDGAPIGAQHANLEESHSAIINSLKSEVGSTKEQLKRTEAKDPVQTERVRKRLEALKAANRPSSIQTTNTHTRLGMGQDGQLPNARFYPQNAQHFDQPGAETARRSSGLDGVASAGASASTFTPRSNSFYADGDAQEFAGLPGLSPVIVKAPSQPGLYYQPFQGIQETRASGQNSIDIATEEIPPTPPSSARPAVSGHVHAANIIRSAQSPPSVTTQPPMRKRAMASDFIDMESPPPKRRVGSDGPIQVVIDVSEDEEGEQRENHKAASDMPVPMNPDESTSSLRNRPSLSNLPSTELINKPRDVSSMATPKSLSELEAEMKAMKEKIAARQRNKRAMQAQDLAGSAGGSTGASNSGVASPHIGVASGSHGTSDAELRSKQQQQQRALAASRSLLQEKLEAERRTHALITAHAENESRQAAQATGDAERSNRLDRKAALEAAIPKLEASIEATVQRVESIRKQQDEVLEELERGQRERQALLEELNVLLSSEPPSDFPVGFQEQQGPKVPPPEHQATSENPTPDAESRLPISGNSSAQSSADLPEYMHQSPATVSSHAGSTGDLEDAMDISGPSDEDHWRSTRERSEMDSLFDSKPSDKRLDQLRADDELPSTGPISRDEMHAESGEQYDLSLDEQFSDDDNREDVEPGPMTGSQDIYPESPKSYTHSSGAAESEEYGKVPEDPHALVAIGTVGDSRPGDPSAFLAEGQILDQGNASQTDGPSHGSEEGELSDDELSSSDDYEPPEPAENVDLPPEAPASISQSGPPGSGLAPETIEDPDFDAVVGGRDAAQLEVSAVDMSEDSYH
jgi:hypothetical protein